MKETTGLVIVSIVLLVGLAIVTNLCLDLKEDVKNWKDLSDSHQTLWADCEEENIVLQELGWGDCCYPLDCPLDCPQSCGGEE